MYYSSSSRSYLQVVAGDALYEHLLYWMANDDLLASSLLWPMRIRIPFPCHDLFNVCVISSQQSARVSSLQSRLHNAMQRGLSAACMFARCYCERLLRVSARKLQFLYMQCTVRLVLYFRQLSPSHLSIISLIYAVLQ